MAKKKEKFLTPEYKVWCWVKSRCNNPNDWNYHKYGGRGIQMCWRWQSDFNAFLSDMGERPSPKHTIDRINNNGNYEPENCKWSTQLQQQRNRRDSRMIRLNKKELSLSEWSEMLGIDRVTIATRIDQLGWSVRRALTTPSNRSEYNG